MTYANRQNEQPRTFLLARNWDRFGGRISEILNCYYLAEKFGLEFKFIWPSEERFPEIDELINVFKQDFRTKHLINDEIRLADIPRLEVSLDGKTSLSSFLEIFNESNESRAVVVSDFFNIPIFPGENPKEALTAFSQISETIWAPEILNIQKGISHEYANSVVIHARYGDLVTGAWRNFVDPTKYLTGIQIKNLIQERQGKGLNVELISDSPEVRDVFNLDRGGSVTKERLPGLRTENLETLTDLFKMMFSQSVLAPEASAFSTLGAHLGGKNVEVSPRKRHSSKRDLIELRQTASPWERLPVDVRGKFASRDIDQELNCINGIYCLRTYLELARRAYQEDTSNPTAINHLAIGLGLNGKENSAIDFVNVAREISMSSLDTHQDPLYFSLVSEFICVVLSIINASMRKGGIKHYIGSRILVLRRLREELGRVKPYQINKHLAEESADEIIRRFEIFLEYRLATLVRTKLVQVNSRLKRNELKYQGDKIFVLNLLRSITIELRH